MLMAVPVLVDMCSSSRAVVIAAELTAAAVTLVVVRRCFGVQLELVLLILRAVR
jgi:hypothetical protein